VIDDYKSFYVGSPTSLDYPPLFELMAKYKNRPMDLVDAKLVVTTESVKSQIILTFDSDFFFCLIDEKEPFEVINFS